MPAKKESNTEKNNAIKSTQRNQKKTLSQKLNQDVSQIEVTAYYIWKEKGCPENSDLENWLEAERRYKK